MAGITLAIAQSKLDAYLAALQDQAGVTIKAAELMGKLHDALEGAGYAGHDLEQFLVRLLFCLFADDTGIFQPKDIFLQGMEQCLV